MDFLTNTGTIFDVIIGFSFIIAGGVASYFLIRYQVSKNLTDTLDIYRKEVEAYQVRVQRLEQDLNAMKEQYDDLKRKKNYLKQILLEAITTKADIRTLLEKSLATEVSK